MMRHPHLAVLLALLLALGSVLSGPAMARFGGTPVELCVNGGTVTVTLDAQGNPAAPHRPCPLCLPAHDSALPRAPAGWSRGDALAQAAPAARPAPLAPLSHTTIPTARGPPLPV